MAPNFFQKHPLVKDILGLLLFIAILIAGTMLLNTFVYRSYGVVGSSMENTLHNEDRVIVNRAAVSFAHFLGQEYIPERGQIIVFANADETKISEYKANGATNPMTCNVPNNVTDQYIIKRVIAFPGERVTVKNGIMTVYTKSDGDFPNGYIYDNDWREDDGSGPKQYTSGEVDIVVPDGELFVSGDNREGSNSWDSRNGLGTIPLCRVIGPVVLRLFPLDKIRTF